MSVVEITLSTLVLFLGAMFPIYILLARMNQQLGRAVSQIETNQKEIEKVQEMRRQEREERMNRLKERAGTGKWRRNET